MKQPKFIIDDRRDEGLLGEAPLFSHHPHYSRIMKMVGKSEWRKTDTIYLLALEISGWSDLVAEALE